MKKICLLVTLICSAVGSLCSAQLQSRHSGKKLQRENELNADHFDALAGMMKQRGYGFISLEEALKDPAYRLPTAHTRQGLSWLRRWMMAKGLKMRSEPREPEWLNSLIESYARR